MVYIEGQGIVAKIPFKNGSIPQEARPYLIVEVDIDLSGDLKLGILVVSTVRKKKNKLSFPTNYTLKNHYPPFNHPSFVKLDSYQVIKVKDYDHYKCANGEVLNNEDMQHILENMYK